VNKVLVLTGFFLVFFSIGFIHPVGLEFIYRASVSQSDNYLVIDTPRELLDRGYPAKIKIDRYWFYSTYGLGIGNLTRDIVKDGMLYDPKLNRTVAKNEAESWIIGYGFKTPYVKQSVEFNWPKLMVFLMGLTLIFAGMLSSGERRGYIRAGDYELREAGGLG